jgi:hypothetical protein
MGAGSTNEVQELFPLRSFEWMGAPTVVGMRPVTFPVGWPVERVDDLGLAGGRLWIAARRRGATNAPGAQLWAMSIQDGRLEPVRGRLESHLIRDIAVGSDGVWLALDGGMAVLDPLTFVIDPFGAGEGLTAGHPVACAWAGRRWYTLSDSGLLFSLNADGQGWNRLPGRAQVNPRRNDRFETMAGSGDWLLAMAQDSLMVRHHAGPQWEPVTTEQWGGLAGVEPLAWRCAVGDGDGGFWLGSDAGLHFVVAETGSAEHRLVPRKVTVPGGTGVTAPAGFRLTTAAYDAARLRQAEGIRERMRQRGRLARLGAERDLRLDPVTPTTRLTGGVRAVAVDGAFVWVATWEDGPGPAGGTSRICLWHPTTRRWVGHFAVPLPVTSLAADEQRLWIGTDIRRVPTAAPVLMADKRPLLAVPSSKWKGDEIPAEEMGDKLAALPVRERAVLAFFSGDAATVVELLKEAPASAESLFLLAFAHDAAGLNQPVQRDAYLDRLQAEFAGSPFAEATRGLRPRLASAAVSAPAAEAVEEELSGALRQLFQRRDLNSDGRIDEAELKAWRGEEAVLSRFDSDGDGFLNLKEFDGVLRGQE